MKRNLKNKKLCAIRALRNNQKAILNGYKKIILKPKSNTEDEEWFYPDGPFERINKLFLLEYFNEDTLSMFFESTSDFIRQEKLIGSIPLAAKFDLVYEACKPDSFVFATTIVTKNSISVNVCVDEYSEEECSVTFSAHFGKLSEFL